MTNHKYEEFAKTGEDIVRRNLDEGRYREENAKQARAWLGQIDRERERNHLWWVEFRSWTAVAISAAALVVAWFK